MVRREALLVLTGFSALTIALTWPQVAQLSTHVGWHYDALFSVWRLAWIAHQLPRDPLHLFDANIFYPEPNTLAFSDALLLQGLVGAPLMWIGLSPVVVYNVLVLLSFVTAGAGMYVLARSLTGSPGAAWVAGFIFAFQPYRFAHYPQIELLWTCWIPLAFWALHRTFADSAAVRPGALLGLFVALQALSCLYYAVFLATALAVLAVVLAIGRSRTEMAALVRPAAAAICVCAVLVVPYAVPYLAGREAIGVRGEQDVLRWSPRLVNYLTAPFENWLYDPPAVPDIDVLEGVLFPGVAALALAVVGVAGGAHRRLRWAYAALGVLAFDLSLGFNGFTYRLFFDWVPPYNGLRVPARMFVIVSAAMAVLAAMGVEHLARMATRRPLVRWATGALAAALVIESLSIPVPLVPVVTERPRLYRYLAEQPRGPVFEWPAPSTAELGITDAPRQMYFSTWHWQPLVNGYSGYYPPSFLRLLDRTRNFPDRQATAELQRVGARYLVLHSEPNPDRYRRVRQELAASEHMQLVFTDRVGEEELALYLLQP